MLGFCYNESMNKQIIALTVVLCACATISTAQVRFTLRGGAKNVHSQGVIGLAEGNTGSVLSMYHGLQPRPVVKPTTGMVRLTVRDAQRPHQQGVNRLVRGTNESTLSQYGGLNPAAVERKVVRLSWRQKGSSDYRPNIPLQTGKTFLPKEREINQRTYEIRVPKADGGYVVYERTPDGTLTLKQP